MSDDSIGPVQRDMTRMYAARQSAALITRMFERFIPDACRREAHDVAMEAFFKEGMELTSIQQRLEMEQIRRTMLDTLPKGGIFELIPTPPEIKK